MNYMPIVLTLTIFLANLFTLHFFGKKLCLVCSTYRKYFVPFLMGGYAVILFVILFPFVLNLAGYESYRTWVYLSFAMGFFTFLLLEIFVYHKEARPQLPKDLQLVHIAVIFTMNLLVGLLIQSMIKTSVLMAVVITAGFVILSQTNKYSLHLINKKEIEISYIFAALAAPIGAIIGLFVNLSAGFMKPFVGFLAGWLLFTILLETYENETESSSLLFGVIVGFITAYLLV